MYFRVSQQTGQSGYSQSLSGSGSANDPSGQGRGSWGHSFMSCSGGIGATLTKGFPGELLTTPSRWRRPTNRAHEGCRTATTIDATARATNLIFEQSLGLT
jgi:hypothetical protein